MQHFYQFYEFFGEEKHLGEEGMDLSLSGFCEQESLYVKFTLCGSRKYPYPPHRWLMEIPRGWGG